MARTPLFSLIRRSYALARQANTTSTPPDELLDRLVSERRISRRQFVGYAGTAAAGLALGGCLPTVAAGRGAEPVLVVGAGLAGLTAAYRLRQAGVPVRIVEAQDRVGGRIFSLRNFFPDSQVAELGGELIDTGHTHLRALAAELGAELDDLHAVGAPAGDSWYFGGAMRSELEVVEAFRPVAARIAAEQARLGEGDATYRSASPAAVELDRLSIAEWLSRTGVSGWFRDLLAVAYTTEYGLEVEEQSALNLLLMIDPEPDPFRVFGESDERYRVRGGNDRVTTLLAQRLEDAIETGTALEAITRRADGRLEATFRRGSGSATVLATRVVLAIPFTLLREVRLDLPLPPPKRRAIAELGYGTNAKLMVGFSSRPWVESYGASGGSFSDLPYQSTWDTSRGQPGAGGILTNFTGGAAGVELGGGSAGERAAELTRQLEHLFPGIGARRLAGREARFHWPSFRWSRGSYASYRTGQWTRLRGAEGEPVGNLYFAGEHCSLDAQGFMEGACESGEAAARRILRTAGVPAPLAVAM